MVTRLDPKLFDATTENTWCAGCGDFAILKALKLALAELGIEPHQALMVSGIGCGSKLPDYLTINGYMTIHGRPLPVATAAKLANPNLHVIVVNGDGDSYGIGGNHFIQSCRRNPNLTQIVENNQDFTAAYSGEEAIRRLGCVFSALKRQLEPSQQRELAAALPEEVDAWFLSA